jgi:hypothetical protein
MAQGAVPIGGIKRIGAVETLCDSQSTQMDHQHYIITALTATI